MNEQQLRDKGFVQQPDGSWAKGNSFEGLLPNPKPESAVQHEPVEAAYREAKDSTRRLVRIQSFRRRLLDPDNLCPKYFIDALRYAGAIPDDRPQDIILEVGQVKVGSKAEERTEIIITPIL